MVYLKKNHRTEQEQARIRHKCIILSKTRKHWGIQLNWVQHISRNLDTYWQNTRFYKNYKKIKNKAINWKVGFVQKIKLRLSLAFTSVPLNATDKILIGFWGRELRCKNFIICEFVFLQCEVNIKTFPEL